MDEQGRNARGGKKENIELVERYGGKRKRRESEEVMDAGGRGRGRRKEECQRRKEERVEEVLRWRETRWITKKVRKRELKIGDAWKKTKRNEGRE